MSKKNTQNVDLSALKINREIDGSQNENNKRRNQIIYIGFSFIALILAIYFLATGINSAPTVQVATVTQYYPHQSETVLTASGYVVAQRQAAIASKGTGRLIYLGVEEGDQVKKGRIIAQLEHNDMDAALAEAQANLAMAKAALQQREAELYEAKLHFDRQKDLRAKGLISKSEFDVAEASHKTALAAVAAAQADIERAQAGVAAAKVNVENTNIRAPFDGTVLTKNADVGEMVAPFAASSNSRGAVVTLADMNSLEVEADVSESNIQNVQVGQPCEISLDAFPSIRYPGYVHKIVPTADRAKATVLTKIRFKERDEKVLPEMSAKINFLSKSVADTAAAEGPYTVIPKSAIKRKNEEQIVFLVHDGQINETPIQTGKDFGNQVEILEGVSVGDKVVMNPTDTLQSGSKVKTAANK